jgi:hypothetical protein
MPDKIELQDVDTLEVEGDAKSSAGILSAIKKAENYFLSWQEECDHIDDVYAAEPIHEVVWTDPDFDLFWASTEILKPAIYAKPPVPVVSPQFKDRRKLQNVTAELLERTSISAFDRTDLNEGMNCTRDDLIFYNRGQLWVTLEEQKICVEHLDRKDFLHPPARKWSDVPWVARRAWMTKAEMKERFAEHSDDAYMNAAMFKPMSSTQYDSSADQSRKASVWEVWHKAKNRVYWVAEGVEVILDQDKPHLQLKGFYPCPRPAYGTLRPRSLEPVPDYRRYSGNFKKINQLTKRIYVLLDQVRMKGLIAAGGDVGNAIEQLMAEDRDDMLLIPVPGAALTSGSGAIVQWLPLNEIATAIQGLIMARSQLIEDFYQLSGISDIMRGATEADETLGAQRLKSQFGSVRVREKIEELQRIAADVTRIACEIIAENFTKDTLLEMSQLEIPSKADIEKQIKEIEKAAEQELKALKAKAQEMMKSPQAQEVDPQQAEQQFQMAQQQIIAKYGPQLQAAADQVPIEDVIKLLRDDKARGFAFEIATDSTILTDELAEKQSRNEFLQVFMGAAQGLAGFAQMGEEGAKLAGAALKMVVKPYRVDRDFMQAIDEFIDAAPAMAQRMQEDEEDGEGLAEAQSKLADAEMAKAQAATMQAQAKAARDQAEMQTKMAELQQKAQDAQTKMQVETEKLKLSLAAEQAKAAETEAKINLIQAQTAEILNSIGLDVRKQDLEEYRTAQDMQDRQIDRVIGERDKAVDNQYRDRQQNLTERTAISDVS